MCCYSHIVNLVFIEKSRKNHTTFLNVCFGSAVTFHDKENKRAVLVVNKRNVTRKFKVNTHFLHIFT